MNLSTNLKKQLTIYFLIVCAIVLLDQFTKTFLLSHVGLNNKINFIPGILQFTVVKNTGGAFSIFKQYPEFFKIVGLVNTLIFLYLTFCPTVQVNNIIRLGFACVLGGTVGNLIDRFLKAGVIDFLDLQFINFAVFNMADVFIDLGVVLILIGWFLIQKQQKILL